MIKELYLKAKNTKVPLTTGILVTTILVLIASKPRVVVYYVTLPR